MKQVSRENEVPANSIILQGFGSLDYCDTFQVQLITDDSIDAIARQSFKTPRWVAYLMKIRDFLVQFAGLKPGGEEKAQLSDYYPVGSKAVYFTVIDRNENEIVMEEKDKHLDFRTSVMISHTGEISTVNLTTIVKFNNIWGKLYFVPVKPFHRLIVKSCMKSLLKS